MEIFEHYARQLLLTAVFALLSIGTANATELRAFEFRVTDHQAGIEDFLKLDVKLESLAIHPKGAGRREGWIELNSDFQLIDIVPLKNGRYVSVGTFEVPLGIYDAVRIKFEHVSGDLKSNRPPDLSAKNTTVATTFDLSESTITGEQPALVLDLYVESQTDHEPDLYEVKVKEIRTEQ